MRVGGKPQGLLLRAWLGKAEANGKRMAFMGEQGKEGERRHPCSVNELLLGGRAGRTKPIDDNASQEKPQFWKRKPSLVKVHMLLLAHLSREPIPTALQPDLKFVLEKALPLLDEMVKIAALPRSPHGFGWLAPTLGSVEMMQCIVQAVPMSLRKTIGQGGKVRGPPPRDAFATL